MTHISVTSINEKCQWNTWGIFSVVSLVRFPYTPILFYIKAVVTEVIYVLLLRHCLLSSNTVSIMNYGAVRKSRRIWLHRSWDLMVMFLFSAKFPHSPIHHYTSIYGALLFSVSPVRCTCIIKYGAVRKFFPFFFGTRDSDLIRTSFAASAIKHGVSISRKYSDVCYCCTSSVEARGIPRWRVTEGKFWCKAEDERKYSWVPLEWQSRQIVFSISV